MMKPVWIALIMAATAWAGPAMSQDADTTVVPIRFEPGTTGTSLSDSITGQETISYTVGAEAGQTMRVALTSDSSAVYFNLYGPGEGPGGQAIAVSEMAGSPLVPEINRVEGVLEASGTYTISVYLYRNAARAGETASFDLDVAISALADTSAPVQGDFADGLAGGPDFWGIKTSGGQLNLRSEPTGAAGVVMRLDNNTVVRNFGCRMNEGRRWCNVETLGSPPSKGWVAGEFLVEGEMAVPLAGSGASQGTSDALVSGTSYNATGQIPCGRTETGPMESCEFGVTRDTASDGIINVTWPDGKTRVIGYENLVPAWSDQSQAEGNGEVTVRETDRGYAVTIGSERYEIYSEIMTGG